MSNITITRRANVLTLHRRFLEQSIAAGLHPKGLEEIFARKLEIKPSMWSQIKGSRPISDKLARQIEVHCGEPPGWLDEERKSEVPDAAEERFVGLAREVWRALNATGRRELARSLKELGKGKTVRSGCRPEIP